MSFDIAAFEAKMAAFGAALPSIGNLVKAVQAVAPASPGLAKASIIIDTMVAAEPSLAGMEQMLGTAITGVVTAFRATGELPASTSAPK